MTNEASLGRVEATCVPGRFLLLGSISMSGDANVLEPCRGPLGTCRDG